MDSQSRNDVRTLLKTFGLQADEAIMKHLYSMQDCPTLRLRIVLEDRTDYGDVVPPRPLRIEVEGEVKR